MLIQKLGVPCLGCNSCINWMILLVDLRTKKITNTVRLIEGLSPPIIFRRESK